MAIVEVPSEELRLRPRMGYPTYLRIKNRTRTRPYIKPAIRPLYYALIVRETYDHSDSVPASSGGATVRWAQEPAWWSVTTGRYSTLTGTPSADFAHVMNRARSSFYANARRLSDGSRLQAEFLQNAAESRKTVKTLNRRTDQLNRLAGYQDGVLQTHDRPSRIRAARRLIAQLRRNAIADRQRPLSRSRERLHARALAADSSAKAWSSLWLEYWMGWAPVVSDVHTGLQRLGASNLPPRKVSGYSKRDMADSIAKYSRQGILTHSYSGSGWISARYQATLIATNPNKLLLRDLGLTNPWLTIHELIPWSWMLAWGHNLRDVLRQWDDDYGLTWEPGSMFATLRSHYTASGYLLYVYGQPPWLIKKRHFCLRRQPLTELPAVKFQLRVPQFQASRLATVVALFFSNLSRPLARV